MKLHILTFAFPALCAVPASAQFTLSGRIEGMTDSMRVAVVNIETPMRKTLCTATSATDGTFTLASDSLMRPVLCELSVQKLAREGDRYNTFYRSRFMASDTAMQLAPTSMSRLRDASEQLRVEQAFHISGGQAQAEWLAYMDAVGDVEHDAQMAGFREAEVFFKTNNQLDSVRRYHVVKMEAEQRLHRARMDFARSHPASPVSAYWVDKALNTFFTYTTDELKTMASLVQTCPDTARVNAVNRRLATALRYAIGEPYADFYLTTTDGQVTRLSALIPADAQFTLLDFWASWCAPCRDAIPHVKEWAEKYGSQLGVVSISADTKETDWRKAMQEEQMPWTQAWITREQARPVTEAYMLNTIPRLILIDNSGHLVYSTNQPSEIIEFLEKHMKP